MSLPRESDADAGRRLTRRDFLQAAGTLAAVGAAAWLLPEARAQENAGARAPVSVVPGRPTDRSLALNVLGPATVEGFVEYGAAPGNYSQRTALATFLADTPAETLLAGLRPNTAYYYRLRTRLPGDADFAAGEQRLFHTQRPSGSTFTFEIQGDSHPERPFMFDAALYAQTLRSAAADHPDFYLTIGDDFSVDHFRGPLSLAMVDAIYRYQRSCLSLVGAPVFLVNGNHEQAALCNLDGTADNVAVWAGTCRNKFFALPAPDAFYSGDAQPVDHIGLLRDYYAWTWGDALFAVIDPYWHSPHPVDNPFAGGPKNRNLWEATLGNDQYQWLRQTLEQSRAKYKFVFTHHILGTGRGGVEEAALCEWGGYDRRGDWQFPQQRAGWEAPIHPLLAQHGVTIFFQGHDHIFVKQQLDGVIYQTLPVPADPNYAWMNRDAYHSGDALPGSGRLRVTVAPEQVSVAYVRSFLAQDETPTQRDGQIAYSYQVPAA